MNLSPVELENFRTLAADLCVAIADPSVTRQKLFELGTETAFALLSDSVAAQTYWHRMKVALQAVQDPVTPPTASAGTSSASK